MAVGTLTTPTLDPGERYAILAMITISHAAAHRATLSRLITMSAGGGEAAAVDAIGLSARRR